MNGKQAVRKLLRILKPNGWLISSMWDGETNYKITKESEAMEIIFNLDELWLYVRKDNKEHRIYLVPCNDECIDVIADWSYNAADEDGFNKLMNEILNEIDEDSL